jgi:SNF2-related domain
MNADANSLAHVRIGPALGPAQPIHIPSNADRAHNDYSRAFSGFYETTYEPRKTVVEAEKDLQDLLQQSFDGRGEDESARDEVDMSQAVVDGFCEGIRLLPHQVAGRVWMTERESGKKLGGILADDMGLGKTIQTLARIVDGRPRKSDAEDGWAATTLWVCYLQHAFITFDLLLELCAPSAWCLSGPPKFQKWPKT